MRARKLVAVFGLVVVASPALTAGVAGANGSPPTHVSVDILGGDHFVHPGLMTNDFRFANETVVVAQGGTITFHNKSNDGHTITLVRKDDVPNTTNQVDNCALCDAVNGAYFSDPNSPIPSAAQLDNGVGDDETTPDDADAPDTGAINSVGGEGNLPPGLGPVLIEDFDTPSHGTTVGDSTIIGTGPGSGPSQRTVVMTAPPGTYHYFCTFHAWMQGTIKVVSSDHT